MRKAALVASLLVLSGCSGFDKWLTDTATLPGENPNSPTGDSETVRRVKGYGTAETPILPESGNIWPGAPKPLPSLSDVAAERDDAIGKAAGDLPDGGKLSIGEDANDSFSGAGAGGGVSLPSVEPDVASKYGAGKNSNSTIEIPNGDGTTTLIHPDGSISTVKSSTVHHVAAAGKNGAGKTGDLDKNGQEDIWHDSYPLSPQEKSKREMIVPATPLLPSSGQPSQP